jgi:hypothetical protein
MYVWPRVACPVGWCVWRIHVRQKRRRAGHNLGLEVVGCLRTPLFDACDSDGMILKERHKPHCFSLASVLTAPFTSRRLPHRSVNFFGITIWGNEGGDIISCAMWQWFRQQPPRGTIETIETRVFPEGSHLLYQPEDASVKHAVEYVRPCSIMTRRSISDVSFPFALANYP